MKPSARTRRNLGKTTITQRLGQNKSPDKIPYESLNNPPAKSRTKTSVLLAHHVGLICGGLTNVLAGSDAFEVCAETDDAPGARQLFEKHRPRIAIVGPTLRGGQGLQLIKEFHKMDRKAAILMLSAAEDAMSIYRAWRAGALGYLRIFDAHLELIPALEKICAGDRYVSKGLEQLVLNKFANGAAKSARARMDKLSDREQEVFFHIGKGAGTSEIAQLLHVSAKTIETYRARMIDKLGFRDAAELRQTSVRWASKSDWKLLD